MMEGSSKIKTENVTWKVSNMEVFSGISILVEINLHRGLKTHLCTEAEQVRKIYQGGRYKTRGCGSGNVTYMSHLKDFRLKMKSQAKRVRRPGLASWQQV